MAVVPWDLRPAYLAYTDWTPIPGVTSYFAPHKGTGTNVTQFHPGQAMLSEHNLPDIMYQLHPCEEWKRFSRMPAPGPKHNPDGSLVYEQWTRPGKDRQPLRDFQILPDKASISTEEAWWYYEFVRRMDPRISQRDIIMREEVSAERLRKTDQEYINIHLNTPGYRTYRPAWKMIAWHVKTPSAKQNNRKQYVLDSLTDAQKRANTTRGSTPGLINPALGEVEGNRVPLPDLKIVKRGPKRPKLNAQNTPATQLAQLAPAPQAPRKSRQVQAADAGSSNGAAAPSPTVPDTIDTPVQNVYMTATSSGLNDLQGYSNAPARHAAAMPPPPLPLQTANSCFPPPETFGFHLIPPRLTNGPPEDFRVTTHDVPEPEYPFMSDEEIAIMSAKSDEAMAEIYRISEPFLDPGSNLQDPPPMDLSAELVNEMGLGFLFSKQVDRRAREETTGNAMPNPAQTIPARNVAQQTTLILPKKQGTKRKVYNDDDENFQEVKLDVEKQERRPKKQVKSIHHANFQNNNGAPYREAVYELQQQQHFAPPSGVSQSGHSHERSFDEPALQSARPLRGASVEVSDPYTSLGPSEEPSGGMARQQFQQFQQIIKPSYPQLYPTTSSETSFRVRQPSLGSPYIPTPTARAKPSEFQALNFSSSGPAQTFSYGNMQSGETLRGPSPMSSTMPNTQIPGPQPTSMRPMPRADSRHSKEPLGQTSNNHRYHPYASSKGKRMEAPQIQQLDDRDRLQPARSPAARGDNGYIPDMTPDSLQYTPPPSGVPDLSGIYAYKNDDPGQGIDVEATQRVRDWILRG